MDYTTKLQGPAIDRSEESRVLSSWSQGEYAQVERRVRTTKGYRELGDQKAFHNDTYRSFGPAGGQRALFFGDTTQRLTPRKGSYETPGHRPPPGLSEIIDTSRQQDNHLKSRDTSQMGGRRQALFLRDTLSYNAPAAESNLFQTTSRLAELNETSVPLEQVQTPTRRAFTKSYECTNSKPARNETRGMHSNSTHYQESRDVIASQPLVRPDMENLKKTGLEERSSVKSNKKRQCASDSKFIRAVDSSMPAGLQNTGLQFRKRENNSESAVAGPTTHSAHKRDRLEVCKNIAKHSRSTQCITSPNSQKSHRPVRQIFREKVRHDAQKRTDIKKTSKPVELKSETKKVGEDSEIDSERLEKKGSRIISRMNIQERQRKEEREESIQEDGAANQDRPGPLGSPSAGLTHAGCLEPNTGHFDSLHSTLSIFGATTIPEHGNAEGCTESIMEATANYHKRESQYLYGTSSDSCSQRGSELIHLSQLNSAREPLDEKKELTFSTDATPSRTYISTCLLQLRDRIIQDVSTMSTRMISCITNTRMGGRYLVTQGIHRSLPSLVPCVRMTSTHMMMLFAILRDILLVLYRVGSYWMVHVHSVALCTLFMRRYVGFCFLFLYTFPLLVQHVIPWAPPWAPICLWYAFLVQFFCSSGPTAMVATFRILLPLLFVIEGISRHSFLLDLNGKFRASLMRLFIPILVGSERLLTAFILAAMRTCSPCTSTFLVSFSVQVSISMIEARMTEYKPHALKSLTATLLDATWPVQWTQMIIALYTLHDHTLIRDDSVRDRKLQSLRLADQLPSRLNRKKMIRIILQRAVWGRRPPTYSTLQAE